MRLRDEDEMARGEDGSVEVDWDVQSEMEIEDCGGVR